MHPGKLCLLKCARCTGPAPKSRGVDELANGGVYVVNPSVIRKKNFPTEIKLSLEEEVWPSLIRSGTRFFGFEVASPFLDIGVPKDYLSASSLLPR